MDKNPTLEALTVQQVADYLHLHPLTIRNLIRKGHIPAYKDGREWRIDRAKLDRWIVERTEQNFTATKR